LPKVLAIEKFVSVELEGGKRDIIFSLLVILPVFLFSTSPAAFQV
jgi:hypothetical protein